MRTTIALSLALLFTACGQGLQPESDEGLKPNSQEGFSPEFLGPTPTDDDQTSDGDTPDHCEPLTPQHLSANKIRFVISQGEVHNYCHTFTQAELAGAQLVSAQLVSNNSCSIGGRTELTLTNPSGEVTTSTAAQPNAHTLRTEAGLYQIKLNALEMDARCNQWTLVLAISIPNRPGT